MLRTLLRVFFAFLAACFAAAVVQVFFAFTPAQIASSSEGLSLLGILTIIPKAMVQSFLFAAPFVLVAAAIAEWQGIKDWIYYTLVGVAVAFAGFTTLHMGEGADQTLLHDYAMRAFLTTGGLAGFVYWMAGGRDAGRSVDEDDTNWVPEVRDAGAMVKGLKPKASAPVESPSTPVQAQTAAPTKAAAPATPPPKQSPAAPSPATSSSVPAAGASRPSPPPAPAPPPALAATPNPRPPTIQGQPLTTSAPMPSSPQLQPQQAPQQQAAARPERPDMRPDQRPPVTKTDST